MSEPRSGSTVLVVALVAVAVVLVGLGIVVVARAGGGGDDPDGPAAGVDGVVVREAWTAPNRSITAVYFTILNGGDEDELVGATAEIGGTALLMEAGQDAGHTSAEGAAGVALAVPPGSTDLAPGGRHLMLTDIPEPLQPGDEFMLQLTFQQAGAVEVPVQVVSWEEVADRAGHR